MNLYMIIYALLNYPETGQIRLIVEKNYPTVEKTWLLIL